jgi:hypothetical protein
MAEQKTKPTKTSVESYIDKIDDESVRDDSRELIKMMQKLTGEPPVMWGTSIIGFGKYHYKYASGHEGEACLAGFAPRKTNLTVYAYPVVPELMQKLGKYKGSKGCIYIKKLSDIDMQVLEKVVKASIQYIYKKFPG